MASAEVLRELLSRTSLPAELVEEFLDETNALWRFGVADEVVAGEAILCHPSLAPGEVRASVEPWSVLDLRTGSEPATRSGVGWRITVVTEDQPGLLAGTAGALAAERLSVIDAAVAVLPTSRLALQRLTAVPVDAKAFADADWVNLGQRLRALVGRAEALDVAFTGRSPVIVDVQRQGSGRTMVTVDAPDIPGLLWAAADWFDRQGCNVEACRIGTVGGRAKDVFIVSGIVDPARLAAHLGGSHTRGSTLGRLAGWPLSIGASVLRHVASRLDPA